MKDAVRVIKRFDGLCAGSGDFVTDCGLDQTEELLMASFPRL